MTEASPTQPEAIDIFRRLARAGKYQVDLANAIGIAENKITKVKNGTRRFQADEVLRARAWLDSIDGPQPIGSISDHPTADPDNAYIRVEVLPTFAGAGAGGNGDADRETALISRALIEDILAGHAEDFLLINVRGDSMEPDFHHGDQLLVDCRDRSPSQPGPFAIWDGEWGEYVVKNVERSRAGEVRIFSTNPKYSAAMVESENTRIIGRPVWYGRRL